MEVLFSQLINQSKSKLVGKNTFWKPATQSLSGIWRSWNTMLIILIHAVHWKAACCPIAIVCYLFCSGWFLSCWNPPCFLRRFRMPAVCNTASWLLEDSTLLVCPVKGVVAGISPLAVLSFHPNSWAHVELKQELQVKDTEKANGSSASLWLSCFVINSLKISSVVLECFFQEPYL